MAAVTPPVTANYSLPLSVYGHVALQNSVRAGFTLIDTALADLRADVLALQTAANDSNSAHFNGDPG